MTKNTFNDNPPRMSRSQAQLATSYSPGSLFIWEGGRGTCLSMPVEGSEFNFRSGTTLRKQIFDNLTEFCQNWLTRGKSIKRDTPVYNNLLLDKCFLNQMFDDSKAVEINSENFIFLKPEKMGYMPAPLNFQCYTCQKVKELSSPYEIISDKLSTKCRLENGNVNICRWRQIDVVFIHWSGNLVGFAPRRFYTDEDGKLNKISKCRCGNDEFKLLRRGNQFSRWIFRCTGCGTERNTFQIDPESYKLLSPHIKKGVQHNYNEFTLKPISITASPVHYVQSSRFIVYEDEQNLIGLLKQNNTNDLTREVAAIHGYSVELLGDDQIFDQLKSNGFEKLWRPYKILRDNEQLLLEDKDIEGASVIKEQADSMREKWLNEGIITQGEVNNQLLKGQIDNRHTFSRKFDPIRLTIEHKVLRKMKFNGNTDTKDLKQPNPDLCSEYRDKWAEKQYTDRVTDALNTIGIDEISLVQNLDMIEYSFGFTRFSPTPTTKQPEGTMPVRLMGFPEISKKGRRPVYVIEQQNEALYFRLNSERVKLFLQSNNVIETDEIQPSIGAKLIESYDDFGLFLEKYSIRDSVAEKTPRSISSFVYLLLHTLSHQVMHGISRFSGLELSSMGEVIFPADLAFLVHRRGVTEDLGNLSSMWRDHNEAFLKFLLDRRELYCGSGTLCDKRGGACPACLMIPEFSCIASNHLLSRAALIGGNAPQWDENDSILHGYYKIEK